VQSSPFVLAGNITWRRSAAVAVLLVLLLPGIGTAQPKSIDQPSDPTTFVTNTEDKILATGDGRARETAFIAEGLLWEYRILGRLRLRFQAQRSVLGGERVLDVITARDAITGTVREVWFQVVPDTSRSAEEKPGQKRYDPDVDRAVRAIMTSGDGRTPETAFVVGGRIAAEYQVLDILGLQPKAQALIAIRGCRFDVLTARDPDVGETRTVYFKLGADILDPQGPCVLGPATPGKRPLPGAP
jgi:hypothetical protein